MEKYHEIEEVNGSHVVYQEDEGRLDERNTQHRLHELFGYGVREWAEAMQELKLKPWKRTETPTDKVKLWEEIGDTFHFFVEFCITAGMDAEDLCDAYSRMHKKNEVRQAGTY